MPPAGSHCGCSVWDTEIETAKFVLPFLVSSGTRIQGLEKILRGRVGYLLKARFCPFDDFHDPARDCSRCERSEHCLYPLLFKPWDKASHSKQGNVPPHFFLNLFSQAQDDDWRECEGNLELTLFGPAIVYFRPLLESVWHVLESLEGDRLPELPGIRLSNWQCLVPVPGRGMEFLDYPFAQAYRPGHSLEDWIRSDRFASEAAYRMQLDCITPLDIHTKKNVTGLSFLEIIKAIIRRMRDLKRAYGRDSLMGEFSKEFYDLANQLQMDTQATRRVSWYAPGSHGKRILLNGLLGEIQGELAPFLLLLQAGSLLGIGANITYGLGRVGVMSIRAESIGHGAWRKREERGRLDGWTSRTG